MSFKIILSLLETRLLFDDSAKEAECYFVAGASLNLLEYY